MRIKKRPTCIAAVAALLTSHGLVHAAQPVEIAQDTCQVAGQQVAAQRGATLLDWSATEVNGQQVCEVVILTPATEGSRAKREVVVVPR